MSATVTVRLHDHLGFVPPSPTATGVTHPETTVEVKISDAPRTARPGRSMVVARSGGRMHTWDGTGSDNLYVVVDAPTKSGMRAHPISGVDRMSAGQAQATREYLGLTLDELAGLLVNARGDSVNPRTVRAWESGKDAISPAMADQLDELLSDTQIEASILGEKLLDVPRDEPKTITVWRDNESFHAARPELDRWPARWWRHLAMRVAEDHGDVTIVSA